jgi:hypothetical protein
MEPNQLEYPSFEVQENHTDGVSRTRETLAELTAYKTGGLAKWPSVCDL